jgi:hypothetical protein
VLGKRNVQRTLFGGAAGTDDRFQCRQGEMAAVREALTDEL